MPIYCYLLGSASTYALKAQNGAEAIQFLIESDRIQGIMTLSCL